MTEADTTKPGSETGKTEHSKKVGILKILFSGALGACIGYGCYRLSEGGKQIEETVNPSAITLNYVSSQNKTPSTTSGTNKLSEHIEADREKDSKSKEIEEKNNALEMIVKDLESRVKSLTTQRGELTERADSLKKEYDALKKTSEDEKQKLCADYQCKLNEIGAELDCLETELEHSNKRAQKASDDYQTQTSELARSSEENKSLQEKLRKAEAKISTLENFVKQYQADLSNAEEVLSEAKKSEKERKERANEQITTTNIASGTGTVPSGYSTWQMIKASASGRKVCVNKDGTATCYQDGFFARATATAGAVLRAPSRLLVDATRKVPYLRGLTTAVDETAGSIAYAPNTALTGLDSAIRGKESMEAAKWYDGNVPEKEKPTALNTTNPADREAGAVDATLAAVRLGGAALGIDAATQGRHSTGHATATQNAGGGISGGMSGGNEF